MSMENHGDMVLTGENQKLEENPLQFHFVHRKSRIDWPVIIFYFNIRARVSISII
jgi:hypothetical protein